MRYRKAVIILTVLIAVGILYWIWFSKDADAYTNEGFETMFEQLETKILKVFKEILYRQPSGEELINYKRQISNGEMTLLGLRQKLLDSEEYERLIKTQTNVLAPELNKMLSDKLLIEKIAKIYKEEKKKQLPEGLIYPYKDVYVYLEYNEYAFRAFLRSKKYKEFEEDVLRLPKPTKEQVLQLFDEKFEKKEIIARGVELKKKDDIKYGNAKEEGCERIEGASPSRKIQRTVYDKDSESESMLKSMECSSKEVFDKDLIAKNLECDNHIRINLTHKGDMVLRPEYEWSVPQQRAPVCTTLGQKPLVQPVFVNSSLLLGTNLEDAEDTQIGSIMPKFQFQEYVTTNQQ